jgi:hypothetical protein
MKAVEADRARVIARLDTMTESLDTWIDEMQTDMATQSREVPAMVRVGRTRVIPEKMDEFKALLHDQLVPAMKKSGADYGFAVARYGTPSNEIHSYLGIKAWADLDGGIGAQKAMSPEEYKAFEGKLLPMLESTEWSMWKFHPELSYVIAPK